MVEIREPDEIVKPASSQMRITGWRVIPVIKIDDYDTFIELSKSAAYRIYKRVFDNHIKAWSVSRDAILLYDEHRFYTDETEIEHEHRKKGLEIDRNAIENEVKHQNGLIKEYFDEREKELKQKGFIEGFLTEGFSLILESECEERIRDMQEARRYD